jgi:hypothetical protein
MHTWVLILTVYGAGMTGVAVDHIPGFSDQTECEQAAKKWTVSIDASSQLRSSVCVEQSKS